jgi:hypothetical protein
MPAIEPAMPASGPAPAPPAPDTIPEDRSRLRVLSAEAVAGGPAEVVAALFQDQVVLVQGMDSEQADALMMSVSAAFGLADSLEVQAEFASIDGHRENVGQYYMTVNRRRDYQFVCPHSEGGSFDHFQLASFYCYENSTDGGETILMSTNQDTDLWQTLREKVHRGRSSRALTHGEIVRIKMEHRLDMPQDSLMPDDEILSERVVDAGFSVCQVLATPKKTYSEILGRELYAYWTDIESLDLDSLQQFHDFLAYNKLLKLPAQGIPLEQMDDQQGARVRRFGSDYAQLFKSRITHKLAPGEFIILNNLTWAHAVNNWTPGLGTRRVVAAFA